MDTALELKRVFETSRHIYLRSYFGGVEVVFIQEKDNPNKLYLAADSMAKILGYSSEEDMLGDDKILDAINDHMKARGCGFPIKHIMGTSVEVE